MEFAWKNFKNQGPKNGVAKKAVPAVNERTSENEEKIFTERNQISRILIEIVEFGKPFSSIIPKNSTGK